MATVSTLAVNLIARTSVFEKKMRNSRKSVGRFKNSTSSAAMSLLKFTKGLALAAGVTGLGAMLKSTMANLDAVSKLSRRLDITTESLLGLRHAAELAGISNQALDKSLEIFIRRMGELKTGSGEAKRGLELLGITAEEMIRKTPEDAILVIADRIQNLATQAEKAAAAYFLFGRAGQQMLNLFEQGAPGIEAAMKEAKELGITLEGLDLKKVEAANDSVTRLTKSVKALGQEGTVTISPLIEGISTFLVKFRKPIAGAIIGGPIFGQIKAAAMVLDRVQKSTDQIGKSLGDQKAAENMKAQNQILEQRAEITRIIAENQKRQNDKLKEQQSVFEKVKKMTSDIRGKIGFEEMIADGLTPIEAQFEKIKQLGRDIFSGQMLNVFNASVKKTEKLLGRLREVKAFQSMKKDAESLVESIKTQKERLSETVARYNELFAAGLINQDQLARAVAQANDQFREPEAPTGQFREIRSQFVDVAALTGRTDSQKLDEANRLSKERNQILRNIDKSGQGVSQI